MMKILAFDTTTEVSSIAVADENGVLGEYNFAHHMDLSQRLMVDIVSILKDSHVDMKDLDAIGVSLGPGSFTGLRIGVVTAKTLAGTLGIPVVGVVSLDLLARQFDYLPGRLICPVIKVRKGEVYYAFYRSHSGGLERTSAYDARTIDQLMEHAREIEGGGIIFCGDALQANLPALREGLGDRVISAADWLNYPKASILARLTCERLQAGQVPDPTTVLPFYIRKSTPEIRLECKEAGIPMPD